jgi:hypothetical protein
MSDLDQRRRTVRVLELLSESAEAHKRGDGDESSRLISEAADVDAFAMSGIRGGILIGAIPGPERDWPGWCEYVQAARDALAEAEAQEDRTERRRAWRESLRTGGDDADAV